MTFILEEDGGTGPGRKLGEVTSAYQEPRLGGLSLVFSLMQFGVKNFLSYYLLKEAEPSSSFLPDLKYHRDLRTLCNPSARHRIWSSRTHRERNSLVGKGQKFEMCWNVGGVIKDEERSPSDEQRTCVMNRNEFRTPQAAWKNKEEPERAG